MSEINKYKLSFILSWISVVCCFAITPDESVNKFLKNSGVPSSSIALQIMDLSSGEIIAEHNSDLPLIPASIMKSVTTAALLEKTGPDWRYHTRVYIDGPTDMGILRGNIIVEGSCDPSLNSEYEPYCSDIVAEICEVLSYMKINRIEGDILIDEGEFNGSSRPSSWLAADFPHSYGTGSHAFNYCNNANGNKSIENPSKKFITDLARALETEGILIDKKGFPDGEKIQIMDHVSAPIDEIMRSCMMRSDNLFAESMLRTYGKMNGGDGSTSEAASMEFKGWQEKNYPTQGVVIVDGSGLSRDNRVTANFMTSVLREKSDDPTYASFFPLAGQEGTLKKFLADTRLDSYIAMKTGSMKGIQCYAGYKLDDDYVPTHVVVIIMNDMTKSRDLARKSAENLLLEIFDDKI